MDQEGSLTASQAARRMGVRAETVRIAAREGRLPFGWRTGAYGAPERFFQAEDVDAYVRRRDARYAAFLEGDNSAAGTKHD